MTNLSISDSTAAQGGALAITYSNVNLTNSIIRSSSAAVGAAIYSAGVGGSAVRVSNVLVADSSSGNSGAIVLVGNANLDSSNVTGTSGAYGAVIASDLSQKNKIMITNCDFSDKLFVDQTNATVTIQSCILRNIYEIMDLTTTSNN